nr:zinc finger, CCHC-type, retrotransposon Gag domain protein [Tanacetum cinerariifolium]
MKESYVLFDATNLFVAAIHGVWRWSTTTSSSPNHLLQEFADELALITFPPGNDDLPFDIKSDLKGIEYLLHHDSIKDIYSILKDSIDQNKNAKKKAISHASLILEDFDLPLNDLPSFKEVPGAKTPLPFSFEKGRYNYGTRAEGFRPVGSKDLTCKDWMVNTRTDADLSAAVQNALQALLPQIRAEIREEFRTSSGPSDAGGNPLLERLKRGYHSIRQTNTETSTEFMQCFLQLDGFLGAAAGTEEEQAKNFQ